MRHEVANLIVAPEGDVDTDAGLHQINHKESERGPLRSVCFRLLCSVLYHWLSIFTELKNRGAQDIFIASVDRLNGVAEAIEADADSLIMANNVY